MLNRLNTLTLAPLALLAIVVVGAAPAPASAQTGAPPPARRPMARLLTTPYRPLVLQLRGLRLTPDQRRQVIATFRAHRPELKAVQDKLRAARAGWQQAGKIDIAQRDSLNQERMAVLQAARTEIFNVLTPAQKAQIQARRERRRLR